MSLMTNCLMTTNYSAPFDLAAHGSCLLPPHSIAQSSLTKNREVNQIYISQFDQCFRFVRTIQKLSAPIS